MHTAVIVAVFFLLYAFAFTDKFWPVLIFITNKILFKKPFVCSITYCFSFHQIKSTTHNSANTGNKLAHIHYSFSAELSYESKTNFSIDFR